MEPKWPMRSVATLTWSPRAPAARWRTRRRRVGARGGPHLRKDLRCDTVHRPTRWWTRGSTGEAGGWRRSPRLGERAKRSICGSNGTDGEPGRPEAELAKNDGGGNLSWPGLLRCRGGGPREAAEDEGLPVLLGGQSARTKGSTGECCGVARRGKGGKGEGGRRKEGVWRLGAACRRRAWGLAANKARGRRWPVGRLSHEAGERVALMGHA
jgi:hypothetical protein